MQGLWQHETDLTIDERDPPLQALHGRRGQIMNPPELLFWIIVLKPGPARQVDPGPGRPGSGTGPSWRKNMERKNPVWPSKIRSKTRLQPVVFFLLKQRRFDFFKKNWLGWPGQNPEPRPWIGPGLKTMFWIV